MLIYRIIDIRIIRKDKLLYSFHNKMKPFKPNFNRLLNKKVEASDSTKMN